MNVYRVANCANFLIVGSTMRPRTEKGKSEDQHEDEEDADGDYNQDKKSSCLCADLEM